MGVGMMRRHKKGSHKQELSEQQKKNAEAKAKKKGGKNAPAQAVADAAPPKGKVDGSDGQAKA